MRKLILVSLPLLAVLAGFAAGKLHSRWKQNCLDVPCPHLTARLLVIESMIAQRPDTPSYLVIGDSITEAADLPHVCGRRPINAGISGATVATFGAHGRRLAEVARPDFVVVALGTNDALMGDDRAFRVRLVNLLASLSPWRVILVPLPGGWKVVGADRFNAVIASMPAVQARPLPAVETTDGIHLSVDAYKEWTRSITDAASAAICPH
jgi:lysophospholipase L1-like esterase